MISRKAFYVICVLLGFLFSACQPSNTPEEPVIPPIDNPDNPYPLNDDDEKFIYGQDATVESLEVILLESFPVQAKVKVIGYFPDGCTQLHEISVERQDMDFVMTLTTRRPDGDIACTEALVPFEEVVDLDIEGLDAGIYTVIAQDQEATFKLEVDNIQSRLSDDIKFSYGSRAVVESMTLNVMESFPVQVSVTLTGYLPDGCTKMDEIITEREEDIFTVRIITRHPSGNVSCTMAIVPFNETVALEVEGLPAGEYTVHCSEISDTFTLEQDNEIQ